MTTKSKLADCPPGSKVRIRPDTVLLIVKFHVNGETRLIVANGNGIDGGWIKSSEFVYLEN